MAKPQKLPHGPLAPRVATLTNVPRTFGLGYVLFKGGKRITTEGCPALEFIFDDPQSDPNRHAVLPLKTAPCFHVYYKHNSHWYGVPKNFLSIADAIPYLQTGNRVLVEYQ